MSERSDWAGSWLSGSGAVGEPGQSQEWRGQRLGLPRTGPGSVAGFGQRTAAILVDWVPCAVTAWVLTENPGWSALMLFAALTLISATLFGRTPGHALLGLRVATLDAGDVVRPDLRPTPIQVLIRTALVCLGLPPLIYNADGRGLHDRAARTIVLRAR